jgi:hypothetical protein
MAAACRIHDSTRLSSGWSPSWRSR